MELQRTRWRGTCTTIFGYVLTVITIKAELAGRLFENDAVDRAHVEVVDPEQPSRTDLDDVCEVMEGYREDIFPGAPT